MVEVIEQGGLGMARAGESCVYGKITQRWQSVGLTATSIVYYSDPSYCAIKMKKYYLPLISALFAVLRRLEGVKLGDVGHE